MQWISNCWGPEAPQSYKPFVEDWKKTTHGFDKTVFIFHIFSYDYTDLYYIYYIIIQAYTRAYQFILP